MYTSQYSRLVDVNKRMNTPIHPTHISFVPRIVSAAHAIRSTEQVNVDMAGAHINFNSDISVYKSNLLY